MLPESYLQSLANALDEDGVRPSLKLSFIIFFKYHVFVILNGLPLHAVSNRDGH